MEVTNREMLLEKGRKEKRKGTRTLVVRVIVIVCSEKKRQVKAEVCSSKVDKRYGGIHAWHHVAIDMHTHTQ
ncbi:hypothetical protein M0804_002715 [Polistes exclamans]|nr:hypothetical protein M0804_002715 [Polistes exclamans]